MKQVPFERQRKPRWEALDALLQVPVSKRSKVQDQDFPGLYREVSRDLALARERRYSPELLDRLNGLVLRGHQRLYRSRKPIWTEGFAFLAFGFPRMVRARWQRFVFCVLAFVIPFGLLWYAGHQRSEWVFALLDESMIKDLDSMYSTPNGVDKRSAELGFFAFAHYIQNNVSIDFRVFAGGVLAGILALFLLAYNALVLGAATGYIAYAGYEDQFWPFVIGHSALEITGIWLSTLAGLEIGLAWLMPGRKTRRYALVEGARSGLLLLFGAATMTALAAVVEGFWSPGSAAAETKYWVGGVLWVLVAAHLGLAGRRHAA
ncbi:MAG: stage II sporulation protein M [Planctomycetes bacterium]|nr:stage II sporulation protein M [Planctomycetota bacterium]MCB9912389.1 stage II sporulation protein M [Planctomycetota bacterium]HRV80322.1 stage II sporulation protein M [Planctomycetota bacterium]